MKDAFTHGPQRCRPAIPAYGVYGCLLDNVTQYADLKAPSPYGRSTLFWNNRMIIYVGKGFHDQDQRLIRRWAAQ